MFKNKKLIIIIAGTLIIVFLIVLLIIFLIKNKAEYSQNQITDKTAFYPEIVSDSNIIYLAGLEQTLIKSTLSNDIIDSNPVDVPFVTSIAYSLDHEKAILKTFDASNNINQIYVYNFVDKYLQKLDIQIVDAVWDQNNLTYLSFETGNRNMYYSQWNGQNATLIKPEFDKCDALILSDITNNILICSSTNEDMTKNVLYSKNNDENIIIKNNRFSTKVSSDQKKVLFVFENENLQWLTADNSKLTDIKKIISYENINWSSDSTRLVYYDQKKSAIYEYSINDQKQNLLTTQKDNITSISQFTDGRLLIGIDDYLYLRTPH